MCYEAAQLAFRIYKDAKRSGASSEELKILKKKWGILKEIHVGLFHAHGFQHPKLALFDWQNNAMNIELGRWGLVPHWVKDNEQAKQIRSKTLNARGESIFEKPSFRDAAKKGRCIIPLDGFFEHHHKNGRTFPYFIQHKDRKSLLVGGLQSSWLDPINEEIMCTVTIVTTPGNKLMSQIHNNPRLEGPRMPLILESEDAEQWLKGSEKEVRELIKPNIKQKLESYSVRPLRGNNYIGNCEEVQDAYEYPELNEPPTLFD
jgi:putative SOS response-associated peptidase YedK